MASVTPTNHSARQSSSQAKARASAGQSLRLYHAWCKRCGNCVAFCPRGVLASDEWGYPKQTNPEGCTACGLCELLCPDFAITVGHAKPGAVDLLQAKGQTKTDKASLSKTGSCSPERLAPELREEK